MIMVAFVGPSFEIIEPMPLFPHRQSNASQASTASSVVKNRIFSLSVYQVRDHRFTPSVFYTCQSYN